MYSKSVSFSQKNQIHFKVSTKGATEEKLLQIAMAERHEITMISCVLSKGLKSHVNFLFVTREIQKKDIQTPDLKLLW